MNNAEKTMANIEAYLNRNAVSAARKFKGSSSEGFLYILDDGQVENTVNIRVDSSLHFVIFELYPGITAAPAYFNAVAAACQAAEQDSEAGYFCVSKKQGSVYYHMETSIADGPLTERSLSWIEQAAIRAIRKNRALLNNLAHGIFSADTAGEKEAELVPATLADSQTRDNYEKSIAAITEYLSEESGHNTVSQNLQDGMQPTFISEILTRNERFFMTIRVEKNTGLVSLLLYPGIHVEMPYRAMAAQYCVADNDNKKIASMHIGTPKEGVYFRMDTLLLDAPISGKTIERLESILMSFAHDDAPALSSIACGILPSPDESESDDDHHMGSRIHDMMRRLAGMHGSQGEDDDSSDDEDEDDEDEDEGSSSHGFLSDFDAFLAKRGDESGSDDADDHSDDTDDSADDAGMPDAAGDE